jgi:hypothetical protein
MTPAGSGIGQFRGGREEEPLRPVSWTWLVPWLLPAGLLGTVVLICLPGVCAFLLAGIWGWLVFPYAAAYVHAHSRAHGCGIDRDGFRDGETDYWRTKLM